MGGTACHELGQCDSEAFMVCKRFEGCSYFDHDFDIRKWDSPHVPKRVHFGCGKVAVKRIRSGYGSYQMITFDQPTFLEKYGYEPSFLQQPWEILEPPHLD